MNRGNEMSRGNPMPGFPQTLSAARGWDRTPSAARGWEPICSAPQRNREQGPAAPSHECSRPRRPQR